ncbi:hypothetical protein [Streptomyces sp. AS58]|nr:hypothetical protein [Streptomyces sp. AS58]
MEFPSAEQAWHFTPPHWNGPEITPAQEYKNRRLAAEGLPDTST